MSNDCYEKQFSFKIEKLMFLLKLETEYKKIQLTELKFTLLLAFFLASILWKMI